MTAAPPPALLDVLPLLRCPVCAEPLHAEGRSLRCPAGHSADLARSGAVTLLHRNRPRSGDDDAMARARDRFLATGAYAPLRAAILDLAAPAGKGAGDGPGRTVLDVGCGSGWYSAGLLEAEPGARGIGLDSSPRSLRFAARAHPRLAAIGADVFARLPLASDAIDLVLDVFSPRNPSEFARVLRPQGRLLVARPGPGHLAELREAVPGMLGIDPRKEERLATALEPFVTAVSERTVRFTAELTPEAATDLVAMTPSARHLDPAGAAGHAPGAVTVEVQLGLYAPRA